MEGQAPLTKKNSNIFWLLPPDSTIYVYHTKISLLDSSEIISHVNNLEYLAKENKKKEWLLQAYHLKGLFYGDYRHQDTSLAHYYFIQNKKLLKNERKTIDIKNWEAITLQAMGVHFHKNYPNMQKQALAYFLKSDALFREIGYEKAWGSFSALAALGEFYFHKKEYTIAIKYLEEAENYIAKEHWDWLKINYYNTMGLCYSIAKERHKAISCFQKIPPFVQVKKDSVWVGIASGNIANEFYYLDELEKAVDYLLVDYEYSQKYNEAESAAETTFLLSKIYIKLGNLDKGLFYLNESEKWVEKNNTPVVKQHLYELKTVYYQAVKNYEKAFYFQKIAYQIKDSLRKDLYTQQINANTIQFEAERHKDNLEIAKKQKHHRTQERNLLIIILLMLVILLNFIYRNQKLKNKEKETALQLQKENYERAVEKASIQLQQFTDNIRQKNELIEEFKKELENKQYINHEVTIERLMDFTIATQQEWIKFTQLFEQVYPQFIKKLQAKYPQLTASEIRLIVLTKLQLSTKEMAAMTGVSLDAIHKSRYRLRKKLILPEEDDFSKIIQELS